jgi:hypothetical protein
LINPPAANSDQISAAAASCNERSLGSDLVENSAQLMKIHRFGEMEIEASFFPTPDIFVSVKSSKGYAFDGLFSFGLRDHVVAAPVGQANVAQDDVDPLRGKLHRDSPFLHCRF